MFHVAVASVSFRVAQLACSAVVSCTSDLHQTIAFFFRAVGRARRRSGLVRCCSDGLGGDRHYNPRPDPHRTRRWWWRGLDDGGRHCGRGSGTCTSFASAGYDVHLFEQGAHRTALELQGGVIMDTGTEDTPMRQDAVTHMPTLLVQNLTQLSWLRGC